MAQLLAQGWRQAKARERHTRYAHGLVEKGVQWRAFMAEDLDDVAALVQAHIRGLEPDWTVSDDAGGLAVRDRTGQLIGAMVVAAADFSGLVTAFVQHVVVAPQWRGDGVGVVTLGMVDTLFENGAPRPSRYVGSCAPDAARFYQRAGYTVQQPGETITLPGREQSPMIVSNPNYPCWFYRIW